VALVAKNKNNELLLVVSEWLQSGFIYLMKVKPLE
jgi:hypothetical protein